MAPCDSILIPTRIDRDLSYEQKLAFVQSIRSEEDLTRARSAGVDLGIEGLSLDGSYDDFDRRRKSYLQSVDFRLSVDESQRIVTSFLPENVTEAWVECIQAQSDGLIMHTTDVSERGVNITMRWSPPPGVQKASLENVQLRGSPIPEDEFRSLLPQTWRGKQTVPVILDRTPKQEFRVVVAVGGYGDHVYLPPFRQAPPAKPKAPIEFFACDPAPAYKSAFVNLTCGGQFGNVARNNSNTHQQNIAEYRFEAKGHGDYVLKVRYGSLGSRPLRILINGVEYFSHALSEPRGGWEEASVPEEYKTLGTVNLKTGENVLRLENFQDSEGRWIPFPHLYKFLFEPVR